MGLALNHLQRQAIQHDPEWPAGRIYRSGHRAAVWRWRGRSACSAINPRNCFKSASAAIPTAVAKIPGIMTTRGGPTGGRFDIAGYLDHQGERFIERFDANAYLAILRTMDTWDPLRGHASPQEVFSRIRARLTFVGISSDWLFPPQDVREFAETIRAAGVQADYREMTSAHGHDAFLAEQAELVRLLQ